MCFNTGKLSDVDKGYFKANFRSLVRVQLGRRTGGPVAQMEEQKSLKPLTA